MHVNMVFVELFVERSEINSGWKILLAVSLSCNKYFMRIALYKNDDDELKLNVLRCHLTY